MMVKQFLIKLLGGYTALEMDEVKGTTQRLEEKVRSLEPYKEFADSISVYVGSYPAWKAQSEYRQALSDLGHPLSGEYPSKGMSSPTHAENVDLYLGRVVDGFSELKQKVPGSVPGAHWECPDLATARGDIFLSLGQNTDDLDESRVAETAKNLAADFGIPEPKGEALAFLARRLKQARREILADMGRGILPKDLCNTDDLEQYVEQPGDYGGFNDEFIEDEGRRLFPPLDDGMGNLVHYQRARIIVSQCIHEWLSGRAGRMGNEE